MKIKEKVLTAVLSAVILFAFTPLVSAQSNGQDDFIGVAPVQKQETGEMIDSGEVKGTAGSEAVVKPTPKPASRPAEKKESLAKVESISASDMSGKVVIKIAVSEKVKYKKTELSSPSRILLQLEKTKINAAVQNVNDGSVRRIRSAPHDSTAWVVIDLTSKSRWKAYDNGKVITVEVFREPDKRKAPAADTVRSRPAYSDPGGVIYRVLDIAAKDVDEKTRIIITTDGPAKYRVQKNDTKNTVTVNILDAVSSWGKNGAAVNKGVVETVKLNENSSRKTVDIKVMLKEDSPYSIFRDQNQIIMDVEHKSYKKITRKRKADLTQKISINVQDAGLSGVMRLIAAQTGIEFYASPAALAVNDVTIRQEDQPVSWVLNNILNPRDLTYEVTDDVVRITSAAELRAEKQLRPQINRFYYPRFLKADTLKSLVDSEISRRVLLNAETQNDTSAGANRLLISGTNKDVEEVMGIIATIDTGGAGSSYGDLPDLGEGFLKTKVYKLNHIRLWTVDGDRDEEGHTAQLMNVFNALVESDPDAKMSVDYRTSSVVVTGTNQTHNRFARVVEELDVKVPQVMIEAKLYEVNVSNVNDIGVRWGMESQGDQPYIKGDFNPLPVSGAGEINVGMLQSGFNINASINALERESRAKLLSAPKITVESNRTAQIQTSSSTFYETEQVVTTSSGAVVTRDYVAVSLPISLQVMCKVTKKNEIELKVTVVVEKLAGSSGGSGPPDTSVQTAETKVSARNNETIVIGGLISERIVDVEEKVPLLGDIPLLGELFRGSKKTKDKVELVVFLTPQIVD
ncbi:MAG: type II secretion system protein GspD [Candidatus Goldiibacteriota bacterium]